MKTWIQTSIAYREDNTRSLGLTPEQKEDEDRAEVCEKHEFYENMKRDLLTME